MARLRTLKPSFFTNEDLIAVEPLGRLLFAGLWTIADRRGRLEDRPLRIKIQILPCDNCDINDLLGSLQSHGFILRYEIDGARYIQVLNFEKHQAPHIKEAESTIPAPCLSGESTVPAPPVLFNGLPSSVFREPEPEINAAAAAAVSAPKPDHVGEVFEVFREHVKQSAELSVEARKKILTRLKRWTPAQLTAAVEHFAMNEWEMEHNAWRPATWFFESDRRIESYIAMTERTNGTNGVHAGRGSGGASNGSGGGPVRESEDQRQKREFTANVRRNGGIYNPDDNPFVRREADEAREPAIHSRAPPTAGNLAAVHD